MSQFVRGPGTLRPSQMMTTFGPGAIYDTLNDSLLIMGTDRWRTQNCKTLNDETLLIYLKKNDNRKYSKLQKFMVPISSQDDASQIPVRTFPTWGVCPVCHMLQRRNRSVGSAGVRCGSSRCPSRRSGGQNSPETVPVRFIAACRNGHLEDFPWYRWVHRGAINDCSESDAQLFLIDNPNRSSLESKTVRCDNCNRSMSMGMALSPGGLRFVIPEGCHGRRPWLSTDDSRQCLDSEGNPEFLRGLYRGGSNVYFAKSVRAITVPPFAGPLADRIIEFINTTKIGEWSESKQREMSPDLFPGDDPDEVVEIIRAVMRKRTSDSAPNIRADEFQELNRKRYPSNGVDKGDFKTEPIELPDNFAEYLDNLVLVRKMREVVALTGFYRIEPFGAEDGDDRAPAPITNYPEELPTWLPAVENRGEGIFFSLRESKISEWVRENPPVEQRFGEMLRRNGSAFSDADITPSIKYALLHSLSHLLIKEISNFAGYSTSSIRERIYAGDNMSGVLIYTSSPSSDGSLGGLVEQGRKPKFNILMQKALRKALVCSMDPLCSHAKIGIGNKRNGSACHACMFLPETSCECMNDFLDRAFVQDTLANELSFFGT